MLYARIVRRMCGVVVSVRCNGIIMNESGSDIVYAYAWYICVCRLIMSNPLSQTFLLSNTHTTYFFYYIVDGCGSTTLHYT